MEQRDRFQNLLTKNEDRLIAKILIHIRNNKDSTISAPINNSWRHTINSYSRLLSKVIDLTYDTAGESLSGTVHENIFMSFANQEVNRCFEREISAHVYVSFLKIIRRSYLSIAEEFTIHSAEKLIFSDIIYQCFDYLEISFLKVYEVILKNRLKSKDEIYIENKFYEIIFDYFISPVLLITKEQKIIRSNKAGKLIETSWDSIKEYKDSKLRPGGQLSVKNKIEEFLASQYQQCNFETHLKISNRDCFYQVNLSKLKVSEHILMSFIELTKWKEREYKLEKLCKKAEDSDKLKTLFLANMSHEIRTPMNAIVGFAELLIMSNPNSEERNEYLNLIRKSSNDLLNIIEDVIDIAKIESRQLKVSPKNTSLFDILSDLHKLYLELLIRQGKDKVQLVLRVLDEEKKICIRTDPKRLKQVLSNLIGNAVKFTDKGQIEIGYKLAQNKLVYFYVKDTGTGIPFDMQGKIFDQFTQVEQDLGKNPAGTGLGLSISKNIINLLGGNIWVSSVPDKGSNFYFFLPYIESSENIPIHELKEEGPNVHTDFNGFKILIAEDEDINYYYLREALRSTGIGIIRAKNGVEAINLAESDPQINLILMDIKMPEVNGLEATRYITHTKPELPIIAVTAYAMDKDRKICIEAGCVDYVSKPILRDKLIHILRKYLLNSKKERVDSNL